MGLVVKRGRSVSDLQWTMEDGKKIWVNEMSERHAKNCLRMLMRRNEERMLGEEEADWLDVNTGSGEFWHWMDKD